MSTLYSPTIFESAYTSHTTRHALAVADAGWFTTESLFRAIDPRRAETLLLRCMDVVNAWNKRIPPWKWLKTTRRTSASISERELVLPSGWMGRFPKVGMAPIARTVERWRDRSATDSPLCLVMTYPQYLTLRDQVRPDSSIYYNVDDYRLYWPDRAASIEAMERQAVLESDLTVCVSAFRAEELRRAVPEARGKILHIPHGSPSEALAPGAVDRPEAVPEDLAHLPRPLLGYVGSLEDRVDWSLLDRLAMSRPEASIVLVGRVSPGTSQSWLKDRERCLSRPNVHAIGWRSQKAIHAYNRSFDLALIPYLTDHPFNIACCPTKIMDGLAAARPIVSTALPECRLHDGLLHVAESPSDFLGAVESILANGSDDGRGAARLAWATSHTCERVADELLDQLEARIGLRSRAFA